MDNTFWRRLCIAMTIIVGCIASLTSQVAQASQANDSAPQTLIIAYHATPVNRTSLQMELLASGAQQFAKWKDKGLLRDYQLLINRYIDTDNPDAVAVLTFANAADEQQWRMEKSAPSGLPAKALPFVAEIHTASTEVIRVNRRAAETRHAVYLVIPYKTMVSEAEYLKYADGYVIPQFEGWMAEGVLNNYRIFMNKYPAGRPWNAMVILEYKDDAALARREEVVTSVRTKLKENPEWKAISENKKNIRDEKQVVIADAVASSMGK